jgi:hypothetical protein
MAKRGKAATSAQREAGRANLAKGRARKAELAKAAKDAGMPTAGERWSMLLDGRLKVSDLDDKEVEKMRVRGSDGTLSGRGRAIPSHIAQQFRAEQVKRAEASIRRGLRTAVAEMERILKDPEAKDSDKINVIKVYLERSMGKSPETIRVSVEDKFGDLLNAGGVLKDVRDLSDLEQA